MKSYIIYLFLLIPILTLGQSIDDTRMNRDIKVAENALKNLMAQPNSKDYNYQWSTDARSNITVVGFPGMRKNSVEGQYLADYGVIFDYEICLPCLESKKGQKETADAQQWTEYFIPMAKQFLADYGSILSQLSVDHMVMVKLTMGDANKATARLLTIGSRNVAWGMSNDQVPASETTLEVSVKDIRSQLSGQLSREALLDKIMVNTIEISQEYNTELSTFSAMFHRLYEQDLSSSYYMSRPPSYSVKTKLGVQFDARVYSSIQNKNRYRMPVLGLEDLTLDERNTKVAELLPAFEQEFKENLINYARTLRSIDESEMIIFDVRLTECKGCPGFPKYLNFSVKKSTLTAFNKGKISFDQAVSQVKTSRRS